MHLGHPSQSHKTRTYVCSNEKLDKTSKVILIFYPAPARKQMNTIVCVWGARVGAVMGAYDVGHNVDTCGKSCAYDEQMDALDVPEGVNVGAMLQLSLAPLCEMLRLRTELSG